MAERTATLEGAVIWTRGASLEARRPLPKCVTAKEIALSQRDSFQKDLERAHERFRCITDVVGHAITTEAGKKSSDKNRFQTILPNDSTRVRLRQRGAVATPDGADYINANLLEYPLPGSASRKYIATQGPLRSTVNDFWTMVWEQKVGVIVMLTELLDQFGREACVQYWPKEGSMDFGEYSVRALSTQKLADFDLARLELLEKHSSEVHIVLHVIYHAWPDYEVPSSPDSVLCLHACVSALQSQIGDSLPLLVHCTAGLGRTGAYILIDILLRLITMNVGVPNAEAALLILREQRRGMVQTEEQYALALRVAIAHLDKELERDKA